MSLEELFGNNMAGIGFDFETDIMDQFCHTGNSDLVDTNVASTSNVADKQALEQPRFFEGSSAYPQSTDMSRQSSGFENPSALAQSTFMSQSSSFATSSFTSQSLPMSRESSGTESTSFYHQSTSIFRQPTNENANIGPQSIAMSRQPSSESEGSALLDLELNIDGTYGLDIDLLNGNGAAPPYWKNDVGLGGAGEPTMAVTYGTGFGDFANDQAPSAADLSLIADLMKTQPMWGNDTKNASGSGTTFFPAQPTTISPASLTSSLENTPAYPTTQLPGTKRKGSESDSSSQPKKRGRPCKTNLTDTGASPKPKRQVSKPSAAKPKSVVPQKYLKDGTAQDALGMSEEKILTFPDFDSLLLEVPASLQTRAIQLRQVIENARRHAAESAQNTRAATHAKMTGLTDENQLMKEGFRQLLDSGVISRDFYDKHVRE
jgi:hypothetical protein